MKTQTLLEPPRHQSILLFCVLAILSFTQQSKGQSINFVDIVGSSVNPGDELTVRVNAVAGTARTIDLYLVTPGGASFLADSGIRFSLLAGTQTNTLRYRIPSNLCRPLNGVSGWGILAEIPANGARGISSANDTFSIQFEAAEIEFDRISGNRRFITSNSLTGTHRTTFTFDDQIFLQGAITNSGCLAQVSTHNISLEINGQLILGPTPIRSITGLSTPINLTEFYTDFSATTLGAGTHTITVRLTGLQTGTNFQVSQDITVIDNRPDLEVSLSSLSTQNLTTTVNQTPSRSLYTSESATVNVIVRNIGQTTADPVNVFVIQQNLDTGDIVGSLLLEFPEPLISGATRTGPVNLTLAPGRFRIFVIADPLLEPDSTDRISEVNESNNNGIVDFIVQALDEDADQDGMDLRTELALGTDPLANDSGSFRRFKVSENPSGGISIRFGRGSAPIPGTVFIVERSETLNGSDFEEIYRFVHDSQVTTAATDVGVTMSAEDFHITDQAPQGERVFYRMGILVQQ